MYDVFDESDDQDDDDIDSSDEQQSGAMVSIIHQKLKTIPVMSQSLCLQCSTYFIKHVFERI